MSHDPNPADAPALDAQSIEQLTDDLARTLAPEPMDAAASERVRRKLMHRIADNEVDRHLTLPVDQGRWHEVGEGLTLKVLHREGDRMSYLVRMLPGSALPAHRHPVDEECVVLEGTLTIGALRLGPGGFHLGRQGVPHAPIHTVDGALIYLRGATPDAALLL